MRARRRCILNTVIHGLVSTLLPVYNRAGPLREAVASVLGQTYRPVEILVVDDGSSDGTAAVAGELQLLQPEIRVVHQANGGPGAAREAGRLIARGEFIQHLDSDDVLLPRKFELQVEALRRAPECGAAYGWTRFRHTDGRLEPSPWKRSGETIETMFPAMLQSRWWDTPTPLYRASVIEAAGAWLPLRIEEDWEYDARIAAAGVRLVTVQDWVCEVRQHGSGHLSGRGLEPNRLHDRSVAHAEIFTHARRAGISPADPEMRHFARELFLLARQCGAAGLESDSRALFTLAREASGPAGNRPQFKAYAAIARIAGWKTAGRIARLMDRLR